MLVITRPVDKELLIGDDDTALVPLTLDELAQLAALAAAVKALEDTARRLLAAVPGPVRVMVVDVEGAVEPNTQRGKQAKLGVVTPTWLPVSRGESQKRSLDGQAPVRFNEKEGRERHNHRGRRFWIWRTGRQWRNSVQGMVAYGRGPTRQAVIDLAVATIDHQLDTHSTAAAAAAVPA